MDDHIPLSRLEERLGYSFSDHTLLKTALTHRSFSAEKRRGEADNERLEFLGDAVLELAISSLLYDRYAQAFNEGELTRMRAWLVNEAQLSSRARELGLGQFLLLGRGEENTGGRSRPSILADAFEAIIGAIYLDGGFEQAFSFVERVFARPLERAPEGLKADYKSRLQERTQKFMGAIPEYELVEVTGPDHERHFKVALHLKGRCLSHGEGRTKKEAEQQAAMAALDLLDQEGVSRQEHASG